MNEIQKRLSRWFLPLILTLSIAAPVGASYLIPDGGVTTAKIAASAVTQAKRAALGQVISSSSSTFSTNSGSPVDVTNLTVTATSTGRPVLLMVQPDGSGNQSRFNVAAGGSVQLYLVRDASTIALWLANNNTAVAMGMGVAGPFFIDTGATAGSHTWKIQARSGSGQIDIWYQALVYIEL